MRVYVNDPNAPKPNRPLQPGTCAVIVNAQDEIFLHRRADNPHWALPGGMMRVGESISDSCLREIREETGLKPVIERLVGLYTSPGSIFAFDDGSVYQSFVIAFVCRTKDTSVTLNDESREFGWFKRDQIKKLETLPSVQQIVAVALDKTDAVID